MSAKGFKIPENVEQDLNEVSSSIGAILDALNSAQESIDDMVTEAQNHWDSRSEAWQESNAGWLAEDWISNWETFRDDIENAQSTLSDIEQAPDEIADWS